MLKWSKISLSSIVFGLVISAMSMNIIPASFDIEIQNLMRTLPGHYQNIRFKPANSYLPLGHSQLDNDQLARIALFTELANILGFTSASIGGYTYLSLPQFGPRHNITLPTYLSATPNTRNAQYINYQLAHNYKIHLMPKPEELPIVIALLMETIKNSPDIIPHIHSFKVHYPSTNKHQGEVFPWIVIYPISSKESAQKVLDFTYRFQKSNNIQGSGELPRNNEQFSSFVFAAQGDGDYKGPQYRRFYQADSRGNLVYYSDQFNRSGKNPDYKLKSPVRRVHIATQVARQQPVQPQQQIPIQQPQQIPVQRQSSAPLYYQHLMYTLQGQRLGWLYVPQHNDWVLINLGFNTYPYFDPRTKQANFFYPNPDIPTRKNPTGLYLWKSQWDNAIAQGYRPTIGNQSMRSPVKHAPRDADVIFYDQYNAYIDTGTNRYWDQSQFTEHEYFLLQPPKLYYQHFMYTLQGQRLGWLYIPQHNDWVLINLGFHNYPYFDPNTGHANFFYPNPDVPTAKNPIGLYLWKSQWDNAIAQGYRPSIGNPAMRSPVKHAPRDADVIFYDQYNAYVDTGTNRYWDQSQFREHEYLYP